MSPSTPNWENPPIPETIAVAVSLSSCCVSPWQKPRCKWAGEVKGMGAAPGKDAAILQFLLKVQQFFKQTCLVCFGLVARVTNLFCLSCFLHYSCFFWGESLLTSLSHSWQCYPDHLRHSLWFEQLNSRSWNLKGEDKNSSIGKGLQSCPNSPNSPGSWIPHATTRSSHATTKIKDPTCPCNQDLEQPNKYFLKSPLQPSDSIVSF